MAEEILRPSGAGNETSITSQIPDSSYHWEKVDEVSQDDDTTYVHTASLTNLLDLYALNNPVSYTPGGTISNVRVTAVCKEVTSGGAVTINIRTHGVDYPGSEQALTTDQVAYTEDWADNPTTGSGWTYEEIETLEAGVQLKNADGNAARCTQVFVTLTYIAGTTTTTSTSTTSTSTTSTSTSTTSTSTTSTSTSTTSTSTTSTTSTSTSTTSTTSTSTTSTTSTSTTSTTSTSTSTTSTSTTSTSTTSTTSTSTSTTSTTSTSTTSTTSTSTTSTSTTSTSTTSTSTTSTTSTSTTSTTSTSTTSTTSTSTTSTSTTSTTSTSTTTTTSTTSTSSTTTSTSTTSTSTTSTTTTVGILVEGNPLVVSEQGYIMEGKSVTAVGWCLWGDSDNDEVLLVNRKNGQEIWHGQVGDVSISGHICNGPGLGKPTVFRNLYCKKISAGAKLYIYVL